MKGDKPLNEILDMMAGVLKANPFAECFVKWTCPGCGERVAATEPNLIHAEGMKHDECGTVYHGPVWGLMVSYPLFRDELPLRG